MESHRELPGQGTHSQRPLPARRLPPSLPRCSSPQQRVALQAQGTPPPPAGDSRSGGIAFHNPARVFLNPSWAPNKNGCF